MRFLVVSPSWIGDTIMMQPLLMRLRQQHPDTEIHVLAPGWSAPLLARMPEVASVIESPFAHGEFRWRERRALGRQLRGNAAAADFHRAYVLPNSWKSALVPFFAGIPERIGYTGEMRIGLLTRRFPKSTLSRLVDRYAALAGESASASHEPHLTSTPSQQFAARDALGLIGVSAPVVFCPGAEYGPAKRWPSHHFAALAKRIEAPVWIIGSHKDAAVGEEIAQQTDGAAINLCGRTTLEQAIDLIATARAVVSNDSGLMHVAAALDRPLVALYGSSAPGYTPPLSPHARILSRRLSCSPCFKRDCPLGHTDCLAGLAPDTVFDSLRDTL